MSGPVLLQGIEGSTPKCTRSNRKHFTKQIKDRTKCLDSKYFQKIPRLTDERRYSAYKINAIMTLLFFQSTSLIENFKKSCAFAATRLNRESFLVWPSECPE